MRFSAHRWILPLLSAAAVALAVVAAIASQQPVRAVACDDTWNGSSADWGTAADWSSGVPVSTSNACLPAGSYTVTLGGDQAAALTLSVGAGASVVISHSPSNDAGTLTVGSDVANAGTIQVGDPASNVEERLAVGGTLTNTGNLTAIGAFLGTPEAISGNVDNQGTFTISSTAILNTPGKGLSTTGTISIGSGAGLELFNTTFNLNGGTLTNGGAFTQTGGVFNHNGGSATGNALTLISATLSPDPGSGSASFLIYGASTLASNVSSGETLVITHSATNDAGTLTVSSSVTNAGTIQVGDPASNVEEHLSIAGTLTNAGTLAAMGAFPGTPEAISGNVNNQGTFTTTSATLLDTPGATVTSTGTISIAPGAAMLLSGTVFDLNGGTLTNGGAFTQTGGVFNHNGGSATGNALTLISATLSPDPESGSASFLIYGASTLASNVSSGETLVITHSATNDAGTLTVSSSVTNAGTIQVGDPASNVEEHLSIAGTLTNTGTVATVGAFNGTPEAISGNVINRGTFTVSSSTAVLDSGSLDDFGTVTVTAGAAMTNTNDVLTIEPGAAATLGPGSIYGQTGGATLAVTVDAVHGTNTFISGGNYNLAGTLKVTTLGEPALGSTWQVIFGNLLTSPFGAYDFGSVNYSVNYAPPSPGVTLTMLTGFSTTQTTPSTTTGSSSALPAHGVPAGTTVHDAATVTGNSTTRSPTGSVTFYLCSPTTLAAHGAATCSNSIGVLFDTESLPAGSGGAAVVFSTGQVADTPGAWCFAAYYGGDATFPASSDASGGECFVVNTSSMSSSPSTTTGTLTLPPASGVPQGSTIYDLATVTGDASGGSPGGTVAFFVCGPGVSSCSSAGTPVGSLAVLAAGPNNTSSAFSAGFSPTAPGQWCFAAYYSGNANYPASSDTSANECVTVIPSFTARSQITPTEATCATFAQATATTLPAVMYSTKGTVISQVDPGVFYYWVTVNVSNPGTQTFTITQSTTYAPQGASPYFALMPGSLAYDPNCASLPTTITDATAVSGSVTVSFNTASTGIYILGIKYTARNIVGSGPASITPGPAYTYTFQTVGVNGSKQQVVLAHK